MPKGVYQRPPTRARRRLAAGDADITIPKSFEQACTNFESEAGGRLALIDTLAHAPLSEDQELLVGAIADPRNDLKSLARICYNHGIQFADLITLFRSAGYAKAQLASMQRVWSLLPDVAEDVMQRSVEHYLECGACFGEATVERLNPETKEPERVTCDACNGKGKILKQPKLETQKVALELGGLIEKSGGVQVNVTQQQAQALGGGTGLGRFYAESDEVLYAQAPTVGEEPVEAEVVDGPDEGEG